MLNNIIGNNVVVNGNNVILNNKCDLNDVLFILNNNTSLQFNNIIDIVGVDEVNAGINLVYIISSVRYSENVEVVCYVNNNEISSICNIFSGSDWLEREVFDMFGVVFIGHNNMRSLLTDYGFIGNPLKKSFNNWVDVSYDEYNNVVKNK